MTLKMCVRLLGGSVEYLTQDGTSALTGPYHYHYRPLTWVRGTAQVGDEHVPLGVIGRRLSKASDPDVRTLLRPESRTQVSDPNRFRPLRSIPPRGQRKTTRKVQTP